MSEERYEESKPKTFKFGAPGDYIKGTLLKVDRTTQPDSYGKTSHVYTLKAMEGKFYGSTKNEKTKKYEMDKEQTIVKDGEEYTFFISDDKGVIIGKMKDGRVGQKFKILFEETKPTSKGNDAKIIKVFWGKTAEGKPLMDEEWVAENPESLEKF